MSEEKMEEATVTKENEAFTKQATEWLQECAKRFNAKFPGKALDIAFIINWNRELRAQPIPKMVVETFRKEDSAFDPVEQTLEVSDLLAFGSQQMQRQLLAIVMQHNAMLQQRLAAVADQHINEATKQGPKLIVPGQ